MAELSGDKMPTAPDRIVPPGIAARVVTGAIAGAALAPRAERRRGAVYGAVAATVASFPTWAARKFAMVRYSQTATGLIEDALVVGAAATIVLWAARR